MAAHAAHDEPQSPAYRVTRHEIYEVVHEPRVAIRSAPSLEAPIVRAYLASVSEKVWGWASVQSTVRDGSEPAERARG